MQNTQEVPWLFGKCININQNNGKFVQIIPILYIYKLLIGYDSPYYTFNSYKHEAKQWYRLQMLTLNNIIFIYWGLFMETIEITAGNKEWF